MITRVASVDITWPDGPFAPMVLTGRGRDDVDGVVATASMRAVVDFARGKTITALTVDPDPDDVAAALLGQRASLRVRDLLDPRDGSLRTVLLDDVAGATLISGYALTLSDGIGASRARNASAAADGTSTEPFKLPLDVCAGWATGSAMPIALATGEPVLTVGRAAPHDDDLEALPPLSMRRRRRLQADRDGDVLHVTSMFRDTYTDADGAETVVHEYDLVASIDLRTRTVTAIDATPGQLPGPDCPRAAGSAARVVGRSLDDVRAFVRAELVGVTTCTHLNDALRAVGDLGWLLSAAPT